MLRSTFLGYKTATSSLRVNQNMMDVVGQNISNINTKGYTRQRLDINSVAFSTSNMKFGTTGVIIGQGVQASGVSQFRDSFLDLRYRMGAAKTGSEGAQLEALSDLESIFDEISLDGLDAQFSDLLEQLNSLTSSPSDPVIEGVVRTSAQMLAQMFNDYSKRIDTIKDQQLSYLEDGAVVKVNQLLENIAKLNQQIKADNISGNPALELNDERNLLIDELSNYLDIEVVITPESIGGNKSVDVLSIELKGNGMKLVDGKNAAELEVKQDDDVEIRLKKSIDANFADDADLTLAIDKGQIGGYIKFLNGKGEFAKDTDHESEANVKGVQYYKSMLDTLANKFANVMNEVNKVPTYDANGNLQYDADGKIIGTEKPLFESRDDNPDDGITPIITAGNIKISDAWANSTESYITNTIIKSDGDDSTGATDNILRMISKFKSKEAFMTSDDATGKALFSGSFQEFLSYTTTRLNLQVADVQTSYDTYSESQYQIDFARSSMSSVDLNEEGVNFLQYSKSFNAASRLMTTIDEMLDTLINRMGV